MTIDDFMKQIQVVPIKEGLLEGCWMVKNGAEVLAYFVNESDAWHFRIDKIKRLLRLEESTN